MTSLFTVEVGRILRLGIPLGIAQLATFLMGMVDTACVGRVSSEALGAVALGNAIHYGAVTLAMGFALALDPLASQAIGANDHGKAWRWWLAVRRIMLIAGVPAGILSVTLASNLTLFGLDANLEALTAEYALCRAPSASFFLLFLAGRSMLQSHGRTAGILAAALGANVINLISDIVLVFGDEGLGMLGLPPMGIPAMGSMGAGITTTLSSATLALVMWLMTAQLKPEEATIARATPVRLAVLFRLGGPISLQTAAEAWLFSATGIVAGSLGAVSVAGHQVALSLAASAYMMAIGMASATTVRVGQEIGSGAAPAQVRRVALAGALGIMAIMGSTALSFVYFPEPLTGLLTTQAEVLVVAQQLLAIGALFAVFDGVQTVASGALRGAGDVAVPVKLTLASNWLVGFPIGLTLTFGLNWGVSGLWWGLTAGLVTVSVLLSHRFWRLSSKTIARLNQ